MAACGSQGHFETIEPESGSRTEVIPFCRLTSGSNHLRHLGTPAALAVHPKTNELYVADGYGNRRVIVFDAATGVYRRHWGAYGSIPEDRDLGPYDPSSPPARQFRGPVHGIALSNDGLVYVADRSANRIQIFRPDGQFVKEAFVAPQTRDLGSAFGVQLSHDPAQRWVYVNDGSNNKIWILRRSDMQVLGSFGSAGRLGGQFLSPHSMAVGPDGSIYVGETRGRRVQKFAFRGLNRARIGSRLPARDDEAQQGSAVRIPREGVWTRDLVHALDELRIRIWVEAGADFVSLKRRILPVSSQRLRYSRGSSRSSRSSAARTVRADNGNSPAPAQYSRS